MKRGFTLIELLIVTVVIVTLMGLVFRLAGSGSDSRARAETISRLQKLSNALSGYYAAFGSYPPVPLQGRSRDIYTEVDGSGSMGYGIQRGAEHRNPGTFNKNQIEAACRAQPIAAVCPYMRGGGEDIAIQTMSEVFHIGPYKALADYSGFASSPDWSENSTFMFGLMSYLLPRYQFMLDGIKGVYNNSPNDPWEANNRLPFLMDGDRLSNWNKVQEAFGVGEYSGRSSNTEMDQKRTMLENLPSQAVCARWMPNLAGIVVTVPVVSHTKFFGIDTNDPHDHGNPSGKWCVIGENGADGTPIYAQMKKTVLDGWGEELYYYSPPPYQSYHLWSSGPNKRTFPPWYDKAQLSSDKIKSVNGWIADDIKVGDK